MKPAQRYVVIGDIHGCFNEMIDLLNRVGIRPSDHLILLGDLIDKGPFPARVVRYLRNLPCQKTLIKGNHEERFIRWDGYENRKEKTGEANPMKVNIPPHFQLQRDKLDRDDKAWLRNSLPFFQFESGGRQFICAHAGVPEYAKRLPEGKLSKRAMNSWLRLRYVTPEGKFVVLGQESEEDVFWAKRYDGRFGVALFGHNPIEKMQDAIFDGEEETVAIGLDGGCVHGDKLRALVIEGGGINYHEVQARKKYAEKYKPSKENPYAPEAA